MRIFGKGVKIGLPETRIGAVAAAGGMQKRSGMFTAELRPA